MGWEHLTLEERLIQTIRANKGNHSQREIILSGELNKLKRAHRETIFAAENDEGNIL